MSIAGGGRRSPRRAWVGPALLGLLFASGACGTPSTVELLTGRDAEGEGPRVLVVVAHPDDETGFVATLHKTATLLDGRCDQVVITNGEGGFKYSTLVERLYGQPLTDPEVGRRHLPEIRHNEMIAAGRVIGLRRIHFLGARDHRYTVDRREVLGPESPWDLPRIRARLRRILGDGDYDFVLVHWPSERTHAHHQAATLLALEAVAEMEPLDRPAVLAGYTANPDDAPRAPEGMADEPLTTFRTDVEPFHFDRTQRFGYLDRLDYHIVVNWSISSHKSQGRHQRGVQGRAWECYRLFEIGPPDGPERTRRWFTALQAPQYPGRDYDGDDAGTRRPPRQQRPEAASPQARSPGS